MIRKSIKNPLHVGLVGLLGFSLFGMPRAWAGNTEEVVTTEGLDGVGLVIGFDLNGNNNTRTFKVGTAVVETVLQKDGTVGLKVLSGSLTLSSPTGEKLTTLTEGDHIELSGFLDTTKLFELLHGNNSQMLRLGAIATISISNLGTKPVSFTISGTAYAVGAKTGRQDAVIGLVYVGPLPKNILAMLKPGQTVIGLDPEGKPIMITRSRGSNSTTSRKSITEQSFLDHKKRAGNLLLDARKVIPQLGQTIRIVLDKTTIEITGTEDGVIIKVIEGDPLKLGTANAQYIGQLPLNAEIKISGLSLKDGAFYIPVNGSVLLLPVTYSYTITNLTDTPLQLGKLTELIVLKKNGSMTGHKGGYITTSINADDLKKLPAGTAVLFTNADGETILMAVGDPLSPQKGNVDNFTFFNITDHTISLNFFELGTIVLSTNGGITIWNNQLTFSVSNNTFVATISFDAFSKITNSGRGNSVVIIYKTQIIYLIQGGNSIDQSKNQQGEGTGTGSFAILVLGGKVSANIATMLNSGATVYISTGGGSGNRNSKKSSLYLILTDSKGGETVFPLVAFLDHGKLVYGVVQSASP